MNPLTVVTEFNIFKNRIVSIFRVFTFSKGYIFLLALFAKLLFLSFTFGYVCK